MFHRLPKLATRLYQPITTLRSITPRRTFFFTRRVIPDPGFDTPEGNKRMLYQINVMITFAFAYSMYDCLYSEVYLEDDVTEEPSERWPAGFHWGGRPATLVLEERIKVEEEIDRRKTDRKRREVLAKMEVERVREAEEAKEVKEVAKKAQ